MVFLKNKYLILTSFITSFIYTPYAYIELSTIRSELIGFVYFYSSNKTDRPSPDPLELFKRRLFIFRKKLRFGKFSTVVIASPTFKTNLFLNIDDKISLVANIVDQTRPCNEIDCLGGKISKIKYLYPWEEPIPFINRIVDVIKQKEEENFATTLSGANTNLGTIPIDYPLRELYRGENLWATHPYGFEEYIRRNIPIIAFQNIDQMTLKSKREGDLTGVMVSIEGKKKTPYAEVSEFFEHREKVEQAGAEKQNIKCVESGKIASKIMVEEDGFDIEEGFESSRELEETYVEIVKVEENTVDDGFWCKFWGYLCLTVYILLVFLA